MDAAAIRPWPDDATAPADSGVAHSEQNLAVGPLAVPQDGQATARRVAHSEQNFAPTTFSVPQFEQITERPREVPDPSGL
jgi:hypothetical protein